MKVGDSLAQEFKPLADKIGLLAMMTSGDDWKKAARPELLAALEIDNTSAALLYRLFWLLSLVWVAGWLWRQYKQLSQGFSV